MKRLWLILFVLFFVGCSKPIKKESLIDKGGLKYHPETKELYSGEVFSFYMGGNKKSETTYKDGKKDGLNNIWYENGRKKYEGTYKDGKQDGLWTLWDKDGKKESETHYKDGELNGLSTYWDENGQKYYEGTYKDDELISKKWLK